jgi:hypothetical protein
VLYLALEGVPASTGLAIHDAISDAAHTHEQAGVDLKFGLAEFHTTAQSFPLQNGEIFGSANDIDLSLNQYLADQASSTGPVSFEAALELAASVFSQDMQNVADQSPEVLKQSLYRLVFLTSVGDSSCFATGGGIGFCGVQGSTNTQSGLCNPAEHPSITDPEMCVIGNSAESVSMLNQRFAPASLMIEPIYIVDPANPDPTGLSGVGVKYNQNTIDQLQILALVGNSILRVSGTDELAADLKGAVVY